MIVANKRSQQTLVWLSLESPPSIVNHILKPHEASQDQKSFSCLWYDNSKNTNYDGMLQMHVCIIHRGIQHNHAYENIHTHIWIRLKTDNYTYGT